MQHNNICPVDQQKKYETNFINFDLTRKHHYFITEWNVLTVSNMDVKTS